MNRSLDRVLIIAEDKRRCSNLRRTLHKERFDFGEVANTRIALVQLRTIAYEAVLLDLSVSREAAVAVCRQIRLAYPRLPLLVMSRQGSLDKMISALDAGADDYLVQPFSTRELAARLRSILRRVRTPAMSPVTPLKIGDIVLDPTRYRAEIAGREVVLTPIEFRTLHTLMENCGTPMNHALLVAAVWGQKRVQHQQNLRVIINRLRRKLGDDPAAPAYLITHKTLGYSFRGWTRT